VDTQGRSKGGDGELRKGDSTDAVYKYDEALKKWILSTELDISFQLSCTTKHKGKCVKSSSDNAYHMCRDVTEVFDYWEDFCGEDNCSVMYWDLEDASSWEKVECETYGKKCTSAEVGEIVDGVLTATNKYYCTINGWTDLITGWSWDVPKELRFNPEITYGSMTDPRDKNIYKTVKIGDQVWMAENLNYADSVKTPSLKGKSWCYDNKEVNCTVAGHLYTWTAAIDSVALYDGGNGVDCGYGKNCTLPAKIQGICPIGWHLPNGYEWSKLFFEVGDDGDYSTANKILRSQTGWTIGGSDDYGFSALPAVDGARAIFWSTSSFVGLFNDIENGSIFTEAMGYVFSSNERIRMIKCAGTCGYSVRCIQD
jgi:uncharacterized protein (TIGR02145 family)